MRAQRQNPFSEAKSTEKGALIVNMTMVTDRYTKMLHRLRLPTMDSPAAYIRDSATAERHLFFCKLDINNMFWSCHTPASEANSVRFGARAAKCTASTASHSDGRTTPLWRRSSSRRHWRR